MRTYVRSRAWSASDLDGAEERLRSRGVIEGDGLSASGRAAREAVEEATDRPCQPIVDALGDDLSTVVDVVGGWSAVIREGKGYLSTGPHELSERR